MGGFPQTMTRWRPASLVTRLSSRLRIRSVRGTLALLVLVVLVPLLGVQLAIYGAWCYWQVTEEKQHSLEIAAALSETLELSLTDVLRDEQTLGRGAVLLMPYSEQRSREFFLASAAEYSPSISWHLVNPEGRVLASTDPRVLGDRVAHQPFFRDLLTGRGARATAPGPHSSRPSPTTAG